MTSTPESLSNPDPSPNPESRSPLRSLPPFLLLLGLALLLEGYQAYDGDQAYRLPLLIDRLDPLPYRDDPFVRAFDAFNPHDAYLALLAAGARLVGLPATLAIGYILALAAILHAARRVAARLWPAPAARPWTLWAAPLLLVLLRAGNIGTNHFWTPMLLDRQVALALAWLALADILENRPRRLLAVPLLMAAARAVHPSFGLQLAAALALLLAVRAPLLRSRTDAIAALLLAALLAAAAPEILQQRAVLFEGLPPDDYLALAAGVQSPQHMLPDQWRRNQWLAWFALAALGLAAALRPRSPRDAPDPLAADDDPDARRARLVVAASLAALVVGLLALLVPILVWRSPSLTLFQPYRMATVARGLAVLLLVGDLARLAARPDLLSRARLLLLLLALLRDAALAWVAAVEFAIRLARLLRVPETLLAPLALAAWLAVAAHLARHDPERGHIPVLAALALAPPLHLALRRRFPDPGRFPPLRPVALVLVWLAPALAATTQALLPPETVADSPALRALARRWRFAEVPLDDGERLGAWCRDHLPPDALLVVPPNAKTLRLWARRPVAFNRAASPYHARGLADWHARYRAHVDFPPEAPLAEFVAAYLRDHPALEAAYDRLPPARLAALARSQAADHVVTRVEPPPDAPSPPAPPLVLLRVEGRLRLHRLADTETDTGADPDREPKPADRDPQ